jgi:hypothetical protein
MATFGRGFIQALTDPTYSQGLFGAGALIGSAPARQRQQERRQGLLQDLMQTDPIKQAQALQALGAETRDPRLILQGTQLIQDEKQRSANNQLNSFLEVVRNPLSTEEQVESAANSAASLANSSRFVDINDARVQLTQARNFRSDRITRLATAYVNRPGYTEENDLAFEEKYGPSGKNALTSAKVTKASQTQALQNDADARLLRQNEPLILELDRQMQELAVSDSFSRPELDRLQAQYNEIISKTPGYREKFSSLSSIGLGYRDAVLKRQDEAIERSAEQRASFVSNSSDRLFGMFRDTEDPLRLLADEKTKQLSVEGLSDSEKILIQKAFNDAETRLEDHVKTMIERNKQPRDRLTEEERDFFSKNASVFGNKYGAINSGLDSPNVLVRSGAVKSFRLVYDAYKKASQSDSALQFKAEEQAATAIDLYLRDTESQRFAFGDDIYDVIEEFRTGSDSQQKTFSRFEKVLAQKFRENPKAPVRQAVEETVVSIPAMQSAINAQAQVDTSRRQQQIEQIRAQDEPVVRELMNNIVSERFPSATNEERLNYLADPAIRYEAEMNLEAYYQDRRRQKQLQAISEAGPAISI